MRRAVEGKIKKHEKFIATSDCNEGGKYLSFKQGETIWALTEPLTGENFDGESGKIKMSLLNPIHNGKYFKLINIPTQITRCDSSIREISIVPLPPFFNRGQKYQISVILRSRESFSQTKNMLEIRYLSNAFRRLVFCSENISCPSSGNQTNIGLPVWADELVIPTNIGAKLIPERAVILGEWLQRRLTKYHKLHSLLFFWLSGIHSTGISLKEREEVEFVMARARRILTVQKKGIPKCCVFLYEWNSTSDDELSASKGEFLAFSSRSRYEGWYKGETMNGYRGLLPSNYVRELHLKEAQKVLLEYPSRLRQIKISNNQKVYTKLSTYSNRWLGDVQEVDLKFNVVSYDVRTAVQLQLFSLLHRVGKEKQNFKALKIHEQSATRQYSLNYSKICLILPRLGDLVVVELQLPIVTEKIQSMIWGWLSTSTQTLDFVRLKMNYLEEYDSIRGYPRLNSNSMRLTELSLFVSNSVTLSTLLVGFSLESVPHFKLDLNWRRVSRSLTKSFLSSSHRHKRNSERVKVSNILMLTCLTQEEQSYSNNLMKTIIPYK